MTGKPCPRGHVAERNTANGTCVECTKENNKTHKGDLTRRRRNHLNKSYKITEADFDALLLRQGGKCAICGTANPPIYRKTQKGGNPGGWQVDHDHKTGDVRGVLCSPCNRALGAFRDDTDRMMSAIKYLILS